MPRANTPSCSFKTLETKGDLIKSDPDAVAGGVTRGVGAVCQHIGCNHDTQQWLCIVHFAFLAHWLICKARDYRPTHLSIDMRRAEPPCYYDMQHRPCDGEHGSCLFANTKPMKPNRC
jgi:hypothetical protein